MFLIILFIMFRENMKLALGGHRDAHKTPSWRPRSRIHLAFCFLFGIDALTDSAEEDWEAFEDDFKKRFKAFTDRFKSGSGEGPVA